MVIAWQANHFMWEKCGGGGVAIQCLLTAEAKDVVTAVKSIYRTAPGCGSAADTCCVCLTT